MSLPADGGPRLPVGADSQHQLIRTLGLTDIIMVGVAAMIGGAIFVLTGPAIGLAGSGVIITFVVNGIITLFTAMVYAELGSALPEAGGGYLWIREGLPRPNAFISGWMAWFAHIVAGSLYSVGFGAFAFSILHVAGVLPSQMLLGMFPADKLIAVASIAAFTYINVKGTSETGKAGTAATLVQLCAIIAIILFGLWGVLNNPGWEQRFAEELLPLGISGMVAAMGLTFIAFEGYEIIVQTGEEVKDPKRNIPRAIFISLAIVVTLYCLMAFVALAATKTPDGTPAWKFIGESGELGISKAVDLFMPYGAFVVLVGGIVSTLAALNATTFSSARVALAMGRNYNLPHKLSEIHPVNKTPYVAAMVSGVIMAIMAYALPLNDIALAAGVIFLLLFTQVNISVITIRRMYGDKLHYGFKTPLFPLIPIIGIILKLGLAIYLLITEPLSWGITVLWILVGFVLYRMYTFKKEVEHYAPLVTQEGVQERRAFRILLMYSPEKPDRLTKYATRIARETAGEVNLLRIITVPHQTPLSAGAAFEESARRAFHPLEKVFENRGVPSHYLVRISHDTTEAMLATIEEQRINLLIADLETLRRNKKLLTLATCDILAIAAESDELEMEPARERYTASQEYQPSLQAPAAPASSTSLPFSAPYYPPTLEGERAGTEGGGKKNMVVIYDGGSHANLVLKITSWLEHSGRFKVNLVSISKRDEDTSDSVAMKPDYLSQLGVNLTEVHLTPSIKESAASIFSAIDAYRPDIVVMGASVGRLSVLDNPQMLQMLKQLRCPVIIARDFGIPGVYRATSMVRRLFGR